MAKKRKTRQEKIILQLKRQLQKKETKTPPEPKEKRISQEAISIQPQVEPVQVQKEKKTDNSVFSTDLKLIRKDLFKTLILTFIIISFEMVLYLYLR